MPASRRWRGNATAKAGVRFGEAALAGYRIWPVEARSVPFETLSPGCGPAARVHPLQALLALSGSASVSRGGLRFPGVIKAVPLGFCLAGSSIEGLAVVTIDGGNVNKSIMVIIALATFMPGSAIATEYLTEVVSEVYQTQGTAREIAARARTCMSQNLASGATGGELIISADLDTGIIVANSAIEYGSLPRWKIRSRFTFEARDGRFRIQQTNPERFNDQFNAGWGAIGKWPGSQWKKAEAAFIASAATVAQCVQAGSKQGDW